MITDIDMSVMNLIPSNTKSFVQYSSLIHLEYLGAWGVACTIAAGVDSQSKLTRDWDKGKGPSSQRKNQTKVKDSSLLE